MFLQSLAVKPTHADLTQRRVDAPAVYYLLSLIAVVLLLLLPWIGLSSFYMYVLSLGFVFGILALSQDLVMGWAGLFVVAPAASLGIGAYSTAILSTTYGLNIWLAILAGTVISGLIAAISGVALLRLSGHFLVLGTVGFGVIVAQVIVNWSAVTGGTGGIAGIPGLWEGSPLTDWFGADRLDYLTALVVLVTLAAGLRRLRTSRLGLVLLSIRNDTVAAAASGVAVRRYQLGAYVAAALIGGLAGGLYAPLLYAIVPANFAYDVSMLIVLMVVIGGRLSSVGIIAAAIFMAALPQLLRPMIEYQMIIYSLLVLLFIIFLPDGIAGLTRTAVSRVARARRARKEVQR